MGTLLRALEQQPWAAKWLPFPEPDSWTLSTENLTWSIDRGGKIPPNAISLGFVGAWSGVFQTIQLDIDVGHGPAGYSDRSTALEDTLRAARTLPNYEVRTSSGGSGFHLRFCPEHEICKEDLPEYINHLTKQWWLRLDRCQAIRQSLDFWRKDPPEGAFELVEERS